MDRPCVDFYRIASTHLVVSFGLVELDSNPVTATGNVFSADCPARAILDVLAGKWALLLIHALAEGPARTSELRRRVGGISEKMLIQTLRVLERHGLIHRRSHAEVPPRVDYSLSRLGVSLSELVSALDGWVERHAGEIDQARRSFAAGVK